jgi:hypothetical protein
MRWVYNRIREIRQAVPYQWFREIRSDLNRLMPSILAMAKEQGHLGDFMATLKVAEGWHFMGGPALMQGEVIHTWEDGWTVQKLTSDMLSEEGCLARNSAGFCSLKDQTLYSIRDENNYPKYTIRHRQNELEVLRNHAPTSDLRVRVNEWAARFFPGLKVWWGWG